MGNLLSLDEGSNSIGYALLNDGKILKVGAITFPMGVNEYGKGASEVSKSAGRSLLRAGRTNLYRKKVAKLELLRLLSMYGMCPPLSKTELKSDGLFEMEVIKEWLSINPYKVRHDGIYDQISLMELGRTFYQMILRRGYKSNSKTDSPTDTGAIYNGSVNMSGINSTKEMIGSIKGTLGAALYHTQSKDGESYNKDDIKSRARYTERSMYLYEFEMLWKTQSSSYSDLLTDELKGLFIKTMFDQRPLASKKHLVGVCTFEKNKKKASKSSVVFEIFNAYQFANTILCNGEQLSAIEREKVVELLLSNTEITFGNLMKAIGKSVNKHKLNYDNPTKRGSHTNGSLSKYKFGGINWFDLSIEKQTEIWHIIHTSTDNIKLREYAKSVWGFSSTDAIGLSNILKSGYTELSTKAINNITPFLKMGYMYDVAVVMGGVRNLFGDKWQNDSVVNNQKQLSLIDNIEGIVRSKTKGGFITILRDLLNKDFGFSDGKMDDKLYHHSAKIVTKELLKRLPIGGVADKEIQSIGNPVVSNVVFSLRKLVNTLINEYGAIDEIVVEMARDLKASKEQRGDIHSENKRLETLNTKVKKALVAMEIKPTTRNLMKYKLWMECSETCPYSNTKIPITDLFKPGYIEIEHILPWSRSLNDSFSNKTICLSGVNQLKGAKIPFEYFGHGGVVWDSKISDVKNLFKNSKDFPNAHQKYKHFIKESYDTDFINSQLNDTRYIAVVTKEYLTKICNKVRVTPGRVTSILRNQWGLNDLLGDDKMKSRDDHRHHIIDAMVIAYSTTSILHQLQNLNGNDLGKTNIPLPWASFKQDIKEHLDQTIVYEKSNNKVFIKKTFKNKSNGGIQSGFVAKGSLHNESLYGKRIGYKKGGEVVETFRKRTSIADIKSDAHVESIVDDNIRKIVIDLIKQSGGYGIGTDKKRGKDALCVEPNTLCEVDKSGVIKTKVFLTNKNGDSVPVNKVRCSEKFKSIIQIRQKKAKNQWVRPNNNHHVLLYKDFDANKGKGKICESVVSLYEVIRRMNAGEEAYQLPSGVNGEIVFSFNQNDTIILGIDDVTNADEKSIRENTYRVGKFSNSAYAFGLNSNATIANRVEYRSITKFLAQNPTKVKLNILGHIDVIYV